MYLGTAFLFLRTATATVRGDGAGSASGRPGPTGNMGNMQHSHPGDLFILVAWRAGGSCWLGGRLARVASAPKGLVLDGAATPGWFPSVW